MLVDQLRQPVVLCVAAGGTTHSILLPPSDWGEERSAGYLAGLADELAAHFGPMAGRPVRVSDGQPVLSPRKDAA